MKNTINKAIAILAMSAVVASCSNNDEEAITGTGKLVAEFDNSFGSNDLILTTQANTTSQGEILKITTVKYIISNIVLTKQDGTTVTYPKSDSYFIVDEATADSHEIELENIPAGNYTKIKFGIGVDKAQWELGAAGQGNFLTAAQDAGMLWSWSAGYKFLDFEGTFTSATATTNTPFMVHTGQTGTHVDLRRAVRSGRCRGIKARVAGHVRIVVARRQVAQGVGERLAASMATLDTQRRVATSPTAREAAGRIPA